MAWRPNKTGRCPDEARGKRVKVRLRNGRVGGDTPVTVTAPTGWPADQAAAGRGGAPVRWTLEGHPGDIVEWDFV